MELPIWITDKRKREVAFPIIGAGAAVVAALWTAFVYFDGKSLFVSKPDIPEWQEKVRIGLRDQFVKIELNKPYYTKQGGTDDWVFIVNVLIEKEGEKTADDCQGKLRIHDQFEPSIQTESTPARYSFPSGIVQREATFRFFATKWQIQARRALGDAKQPPLPFRVDCKNEASNLIELPYPN